MCDCACVWVCICYIAHHPDVPSRWPHHPPLSNTAGRGGHSQQLSKLSCITINLTTGKKKRAESKSSLCAFNHVSPSVCMYVCEFSCVCVIEHMCVYHDASPQLSHSFPAASRGWKRVKPQTSGAPQPIRIVYLASHGRLAEQEHTASHTALRWKPLLSFSLSLFFHSFKPLLAQSPLSLLSTLCPRSPNFITLQSDVTFPGCSRSLKLIIVINKSEILWFVY